MMIINFGHAIVEYNNKKGEFQTSEISSANIQNNYPIHSETR